jgi:hypothetical protein
MLSEPEPAAVPTGLLPAELEDLFPLVADQLDRVAPSERTRFLCKAFFLLANAGGSLSAARLALEEAAETQTVPGRSKPNTQDPPAEEQQR